VRNRCKPWAKAKIEIRGLIQLAPVTCLALHLSQFVDSFGALQFGRRGIDSAKIGFF